MPALSPALLAQLRGRVEAAMESTVVLCTKVSTNTAGGQRETIVEGASVPGRVYKEALAVPVEGGMGTGGAWTTVTVQYLEIPAAYTLAQADLVKIGGLYYEVTGEDTRLTETRSLAHQYRIARMQVGA